MRRRTSDSQPDENGTANRTKEELRELFLKLNLSIIIPEPPPSPPPPTSGESGSSSGNSGVKHIHYISIVNVLLTLQRIV